MKMTIIQTPWDGRPSHSFLRYFTNTHWVVKDENYEGLPPGQYYIVNNKNGDQVLIPVQLVWRSPEYIYDETCEYVEESSISRMGEIINTVARRLGIDVDDSDKGVAFSYYTIGGTMLSRHNRIIW